MVQVVVVGGPDISSEKEKKKYFMGGFNCVPLCMKNGNSGSRSEKRDFHLVEMAQKGIFLFSNLSLSFRTHIIDFDCLNF